MTREEIYKKIAEIQCRLISISEEEEELKRQHDELQKEYARLGEQHEELQRIFRDFN